MNLTKIKEELIDHLREPVVVCHPSMETKVRAALDDLESDAELIVNKWVDPRNIYVMEATQFVPMLESPFL